MFEDIFFLMLIIILKKFYILINLAFFILIIHRSSLKSRENVSVFKIYIIEVCDIRIM